MVRTTLSHEQAEAVYDRVGKRQDSQGFYEDVAVDALIAQARFDEAREVLEVGCGTGKLAVRLLKEVLPEDAHYQGVDLSETMVRLARERLEPFASRARVSKTDGSLTLAFSDESCDRVVSTYVVDLLSDEDIELFLEESWRLLQPGGRLACAGLTVGERGVSRIVTGLWRTIHWLHPALVGGCRPLVLANRLDARRWKLLHRSVVIAYGIASEVLVAEKRV